MEGGENSNEPLDDNLLEPLSEVSFSEREKSYHSVLVIDSDTTLQDNNAKLLHLQRVQRAGDSSNDTVNSSASKKQSKANNTGENEETVNLSLESIIRRGLNEQKIQSNFNTTFKFGKPDDNISLRVNPSADLIYEHSNSSKSDSYESSGDHDDMQEADIMEMNGTVNGGGSVNNSVQMKRKRGRPKLTEQQKIERVAEKEAQKSTAAAAAAAAGAAAAQNNSSMLGANVMPTQVDELMAMGHSLFSELAPRKRGRPKKQIFEQFSDANVSMESNSQDDSQDDSQGNEIPMKKKRGRKPKAYYEQLAAMQSDSGAHDESIDVNSSQQTVEDIKPHTSLLKEPKKRGRKPKYLENYYVKLDLEQPTYGEAVQNQNVIEQQNGSNHQELLNQPIVKKRGRKPKSFYLQQAADQRLNETAPAIMHSEHDVVNHMNNSTVMHFSSTPNTSLNLDAYKNKRGRKPKAYYEQLAALRSQQQPESNDHSMLNDQTMSETEVTTTDRSTLSVRFNDTISSEPPAKKKRGRKPKSYYLELQQAQMLSNQSTPNAEMSQSDLKAEASSSRSDNLIGENGQHSMENHNSFLPTKRIPKPSIKQFIPNRRVYIKKLPHQKLYRRPVNPFYIFIHF